MEGTDRDFLEAFEAKTLPPEAFNHRGHVRLAFLCLAQAPFAVAAARCGELIRAYAIGQGAGEKYHDTLTFALMRLISARMPAEPLAFDEWLKEVPELGGEVRELLAAHYSPERLADPAARAGYLEPDRMPLPEACDLSAWYKKEGS